MAKPPNSRSSTSRIDGWSARSRASTAKAAPPIRKPNAITDDAAAETRQRQRATADTQAGSIIHAQTCGSKETFSPTVAPISRARAGMEAAAATARLMQVAASPGVQQLSVGYSQSA